MIIPLVYNQRHTYEETLLDKYTTHKANIIRMAGYPYNVSTCAIGPCMVDGSSLFIIMVDIVSSSDGDAMGEFVFVPIVTFRYFPLLWFQISYYYYCFAIT